MIRLPQELTPSELLCREELPSFIDELLSRVRRLRRQGRLSEAIQSAQAVVTKTQEPGHWIDLALALVHLADIHHNVGKLGPALSSYQRAYRLLRQKTSRCQRHNEAVVIYALGLVSQSLGNEIDALQWYEEADRQCEQVIREWATVNATNHIETCVRIRQWVETLQEYLTRTGARIGVSPTTRICIPVVLWKAKGGFALAEVEVDRFVLERESRLQLRVGEHILQTRRLKGTQRVYLEPDGEYYVIEVPPEVQESLGANEGDYALVKRQSDITQEGYAILETADGPVFGKFNFDEAGEVVFIGANATILGGAEIDDDVLVGYITALLKGN